MNCRSKKPLKILIILMLALTTSHYSEQHLIKPLTALKHLILFSSLDRFDKQKDQIYTNYSFLDEPVINPVHVAQQAFKPSESYLFEINLQQKNKHLYDQDINFQEEIILKTADQIIKNFPPEEINGSEIIRLPYNFYYPSYDLNQPWYSGMAQGLAVVVLLAAYEISDNNRYLNSASKIGLTLTVPISDGGTLIIENKENFWHEEYADSTKIEHPKVLNGNNFAIDGIYWLSRYSDDPIWDTYLKNSIKSLNNNIHLYDAFFWSRYGLFGNYANWKYHSLHIVQLEKIAEIYSENLDLEIDNINKYLIKFKRYKYIPLGFFERLLFQSNNMLFAVLLINLFLIYVSCLITKHIRNRTIDI